LAILTAIFSDHSSAQDLEAYYGSFFGRLYPLEHLYNLLFIFIFLSFVFAGVGIIGGVLEYVGEAKEATEVYHNYEKSSGIKLYGFLLVYGYIFLFAVFSLSEFLIFAFKWEYPDTLWFVPTFISYMLFDSVILMVIGSVLFGYKTFKFGVHSMEFYKTDYDPDVTDISKTRRGFRQFMGCSIGTMGVFCSLLVFVFDLFPVSDIGSFHIPKAFFFLTATIQSVYFYTHREKYIDQLKPIDEQYGLKVGSGPLKKEGMSEEEEEDEDVGLGLKTADQTIDDDDIASDLKFND